MKRGGLLTAFCLFLLSACGFHLRGTDILPPWLDSVAIISKNNDKQFVSLLQARLERSGVRVESEPSLARYWLMLNNINLQQQIISVGSSTNPRQYTLTLNVLFILKTRTGTVLNDYGMMTITRQLTLNNDRILGSKDEETIIIGEMKQDAVNQMMARIAHLQPGAVVPI